jgi:hypothetical protein
MQAGIPIPGTDLSRNVEVFYLVCIGSLPDCVTQAGIPIPGTDLSRIAEVFLFTPYPIPVSWFYFLKSKTTFQKRVLLGLHE